MRESEQNLNLEQIALEVRQQVVLAALRSGSGHIASALSMVEILTYLFFEKLQLDLDVPAKGDSFVLSKGHGALSLYAVQFLKGLIGEELMESYHKSYSVMTSFPTEPFLPGLTFGCASLGHGLSVAVGSALAQKHDGAGRNTYAVLSDGECQEGAVWEAILFASQHKLDNLYIVIDYNKIQAIGPVSEVIGLEPFADKWKAFGCDCIEVDGHDLAALKRAFDCKFQADCPRVIIAHTVKGKGISFMENTIDWHYLPLTDKWIDFAKQAVRLA